MSAAKYVKLPVVVDAIEWAGNNMFEVSQFMGAYSACNYTRNTISIETLEGIMVANLGDMIIRGVDGEFYPCKPDIFKRTYKLYEGEV